MNPDLCTIHFFVKYDLVDQHHSRFPVNSNKMNKSIQKSVVSSLRSFHDQVPLIEFFVSHMFPSHLIQHLYNFHIDSKYKHCLHISFDFDAFHIQHEFALKSIRKPSGDHPFWSIPFHSHQIILDIDHSKDFVFHDSFHSQLK